MKEKIINFIKSGHGIKAILTTLAIILALIFAFTIGAFACLLALMYAASLWIGDVVDLVFGKDK